MDSSEKSDDIISKIIDAILRLGYVILDKSDMSSSERPLLIFRHNGDVLAWWQAAALQRVQPRWAGLGHTSPYILPAWMYRATQLARAVGALAGAAGVAGSRKSKARSQQVELGQPAA